jgi:hypothetical protein
VVEKNEGLRVESLFPFLGGGGHKCALLSPVIEISPSNNAKTRVPTIHFTKEAKIFASLDVNIQLK